MQKDTEEGEGQNWIRSVIGGTRMTEHKGILRSGLLLEIKLDLLYLTETSPAFSKAREREKCAKYRQKRKLTEEPKHPRNFQPKDLRAQLEEMESVLVPNGKSTKKQLLGTYFDSTALH